MCYPVFKFLVSTKPVLLLKTDDCVRVICLTQLIALRSTGASVLLNFLPGRSGKFFRNNNYNNNNMILIKLIIIMIIQGIDD